MTENNPNDFSEVFSALKALMTPYEADLVVKTDEPGNYYLNTPTQREDGYVYAFGGVQVKKRYVSYHLLPVYAVPELLETASGALKKRMQGKSCFNFRTVDEALFTELSELTRRGFEAFRAKAMV